MPSQGQQAITNHRDSRKQQQAQDGDTGTTPVAAAASNKEDYSIPLAF